MLLTGHDREALEFWDNSGLSNDPVARTASEALIQEARDRLAGKKPEPSPPPPPEPPAYDPRREWRVISTGASMARLEQAIARGDREAVLSEWPEVRECHMLAGETDFLLRVVAKDWDAYQKFVTEKLTAAPKVANVKSALAIRSAKNLPGVPIAVDGDKPAQPPLAMPMGVGT